MEIERFVNGELTKNIEQCVGILMDVERRVQVLRAELVSTLNQVPGRPTTPQPTFTGFGPATPASAPAFAPPAYAPAHVQPTNGFAHGYPAGSATPVATWGPHSAWTPWAAPTPAFHGVPQGFSPVGYPPVQAYPYGSFGPFVHTSLPRAAAQGFGYIW